MLKGFKVAYAKLNNRHIIEIKHYEKSQAL